MGCRRGATEHIRRRTRPTHFRLDQFLGSTPREGNFTSPRLWLRNSVGETPKCCRKARENASFAEEARGAARATLAPAPNWEHLGESQP